MNYTWAKFKILINKFFFGHLKEITADTLGWMASVTLHLSTVPSMLAYMSGLSDKPPNLDLVLFIFAALVLLFARAVIRRDQLNTITIGVGFIGQAVLMAFIMFR